VATKYQYGTLTRRKRMKGPDVWQFRFFEDGERKAVVIGNVEELPTKADAERAVEQRRTKLNVDIVHRSVTVNELFEKFMKHYAAKRCRRLTQKTYRSFFNNHITPKWGDQLVRKVRPVEILEWLEEYPYSMPIKSHIRNLMHTMFEAAVMRWELAASNPVPRRVTSKARLKTPRILTPPEFKALLAELEEPYRTMVIIIACLGLRVSELIGLRWSDFNFEKLLIEIRRSVVEGEVNPTKTSASESELPLDSELAELILIHRGRCSYLADSDYVFANNAGNPPWPDGILTDHLKPAALRAGIGKVGSHTFRHTYSSLLHTLGAKPAVQKELLRHTDIRTTLNIYTQAISAEKREAHELVVKNLWK
jgi:integrase